MGLWDGTIASPIRYAVPSAHEGPHCRALPKRKQGKSKRSPVQGANHRRNQPLCAAKHKRTGAILCKRSASALPLGRLWVKMSTLRSLVPRKCAACIQKPRPTVSRSRFLLGESYLTDGLRTLDNSYTLILRIGIVHSGLKANSIDFGCYRVRTLAVSLGRFTLVDGPFGIQDNSNETVTFRRLMKVLSCLTPPMGITKILAETRVTIFDIALGTGESWSVLDEGRRGCKEGKSF